VCVCAAHCTPASLPAFYHALHNAFKIRLYNASQRYRVAMMH